MGRCCFSRGDTPEVAERFAEADPYVRRRTRQRVAGEGVDDGRGRGCGDAGPTGVVLDKVWSDLE